MNNRQGNGRRRGRNNGNNNQRPQGNGRGGDSGNRIDSRARGNAAQLLEKYRNMARDAQLSGDRVMTEYYLQFADHYFRVLSDARNRQEEQRARFDGDRDGEDRDGGNQPGQSEDEAEDIDELDAIDMIGRAPRNRGNGNNGGQNREFNGNRDDRPRDGNRDGNRDFNRDRPRDDRPREDRQREDRQREDRPMRGEQRDARPPREGGEDRGLRQRRERPARIDRDQDDTPAVLDLAVLPPAIGLDTPAREDIPVASNDEAPAPKKRGRPRKVVGEGEGEAA